ncbi:MAG: nucleoside hydrolase [Planctomycetaceae bacterium]
MAQKIIIDADPGIGDALALAVALFDSELDVLGVTATAGTVSGPVAARNAQAIVEALDPPKWPRLGCSDAEQPVVDLNFGSKAFSPAALNGESGLGDFQFAVADLHHQRESAKVMIDLVRDNPHEVTLLTLGPLTNVHLACERAPEFLELIRSLVCFAGSVQVGGDVTAAAEFNVYADPVAARNVLRSPATKTMVPLDVSRKAVLTFEQASRLPQGEDSRVGRLLQSLLPYAFRASHQHLGLEGVRLNELVALAAVSRPRLFATRAMDVDVETRGELTRGMTVFDRRGIRNWQTNIEVAYEVDGQGVIDYLTGVLSRARE